MLEKLIRRVNGFNSLTDPAKQGPIRVVDGDDIEWDGKRYRLADFDAPEIVNLRSKVDKSLEQARGYKAMRRLRELIETASLIDLIPSNKTVFPNRLLAVLMINGKDVADIACDEGWACRFRDRRKRDWGDPATPFPDDALPGVELPNR